MLYESSRIWLQRLLLLTHSTGVVYFIRYHLIRFDSSDYDEQLCWSLYTSLYVNYDVTKEVRCFTGTAVEVELNVKEEEKPSLFTCKCVFVPPASPSLQLGYVSGLCGFLAPKYFSISRRQLSSSRGRAAVEIHYVLRRSDTHTHTRISARTNIELPRLVNTFGPDHFWCLNLNSNLVLL